MVMDPHLSCKARKGWEVFLRDLIDAAVTLDGLRLDRMSVNGRPCQCCDRGCQSKSRTMCFQAEADD